MTAPAENLAADPVASTGSPSPNLGLKAALLAALATLPFLPTLRGSFFWDDAINIEINRSLRTPAGLKAIWIDPLASFQYYPLTYSLFWMEFQVFGERPFGYHVVSLVLHAFNALLAWRTLVSIRAPAPWWVAALFAVHPIQVETVGWISEQKNLLSTLFSLLALRLWEQIYRDNDPAGAKPPLIESRRAFVVATVAFIAALLAKTVALVLPFWIVVREVVLRRAPTSRWLPRQTIWIILGIAAGIMTSWRESASSTSTGSPSTTPPSLKIDERIALTGESLCRYAGMLCCFEPFVPVPVRSIPSWREPTAIACTVGVLAALWYALLEFRGGRPWPLLGLTFFVMQLGPTLGLVRFQFQCHSFVADHFAYSACLGFFIALVASLQSNLPALFRPAGAVLLAALAVATWMQSRVFADPVRLWSASIQANPKAWAAHVNLADALLKTDNPTDALKHAQRAVELEPSAAMGHENLGIALARLGRPHDAERAFREALRLRPDDPQFHHNLANVLVKQDRLREAIEEYRTAADRAPDFAMTHYLMGNAYRKLEMIPEARASWTRAVELNPSFEAARKALDTLNRRSTNQLK